MNNKYLKFLDFILDILSEKYGSESTLINLSHKYNKKFNIEIKYDEIEYLEDKYFNDLFEPIGNLGLFKLTPTAKDIKDTFGSYSNYFESHNQEIVNCQEIKELEKENLNLDIENKKYLKTIRVQESRIRDLEEQTKFIELLKLYWWILLVCLVIGIGIKELWDIIV